jgi:D-ribulokinase
MLIVRTHTHGLAYTYYTYTTAEQLAGLLQSLSRVEAECYALLHALGATPPVSTVKTAGGGSRNNVWTKMRQKKLGVPVATAVNSDAAYGVAVLGLSQIGK